MRSPMESLGHTKTNIQCSPPFMLPWVCSSRRSTPGPSSRPRSSLVAHPMSTSTRMTLVRASRTTMCWRAQILAL